MNPLQIHDVRAMAYNGIVAVCNRTTSNPVVVAQRFSTDGKHVDIDLSDSTSFRIEVTRLK